MKNQYFLIIKGFNKKELELIIANIILKLYLSSIYNFIIKNTFLNIRFDLLKVTRFKKTKKIGVQKSPFIFNTSGVTLKKEYYKYVLKLVLISNAKLSEISIKSIFKILLKNQKRKAFSLPIEIKSIEKF